MTLTDSEALHFFQLWHRLMYFIDQDSGAEQDWPETFPGLGNLPFTKVTALRQRLWESPTLLGKFLATDPPLSAEDKATLADWEQYHLIGRFVALKHLKKHSIVMPLGKENVAYAIVTPSSPLEERLPYAPPALFDGVLLPFAGKIITDGLYGRVPVMLGSGYRASFKDALRNIEESVGLTTSLLPDPKTQRLRLGEGNVRLLKAFQRQLAGQGLSEKVIAQNLDVAQAVAAALIMEESPRALLHLDLETAQAFLQNSPKASTELKRFARFLYDTERGSQETVIELQELRRRQG